jgi:hypothetical protein
MNVAGPRKRGPACMRHQRRPRGERHEALPGTEIAAHPGPFACAAPLVAAVLVSVVIGLAWPMIAFLPAELAAGEGTPDIASVLAAVLDAWIGALPVLVPSVLAGAAVGLLIAGMWGVRHRWVPGAICAISGWYLALVLATLIG